MAPREATNEECENALKTRYWPGTFPLTRKSYLNLLICIIKHSVVQPASGALADRPRLTILPAAVARFLHFCARTNSVWRFGAGWPCVAGGAG